MIAKFAREPMSGLGAPGSSVARTLAVVLAAALVAGCATPGMAPRTGPLRLLAIGDSISLGFSDRAYVVPFVQNLAGWETQNLSQNGTSAADWLRNGCARVAKCLRDDEIHVLDRGEPADVVHLMLGTNDSGLWVRPAKFEQNLRQLVAELRRRWPGATVLLSHPPNLGAGFRPARFRLMDAYHSALERVVESTPAQLGVDFRPLISAALFADRLHPSEAGQDAMRAAFQLRLDALRADLRTGPAGSP